MIFSSRTSPGQPATQDPALFVPVEGEPRVPERPWRTLLPVCLLGLCALPLILWGLLPSSSTRLYLWPETGLLQLSQLALLAVGIGVFALRPPTRAAAASTPLQLAAFGWLLGYGQSLFSTEFPTRVALGVLAPLVLLATAYTLSACLSGGPPERAVRLRRWLLRALATIGTATVLASSWSWMGDLNGDGPLARNLHPFGHASQVGGFGLLVLTAGLCLLAARLRDLRWDLPRHPDGVLAALAIGGGGFLILTSQSRGALLGLGLMALLTLVRFRPRTWKYRLATITLVLALGSLALALSPRLQEMTSGLIRGELLGSDSTRVNYAQTAWHALVDAPLTGLGAFTTDLVYPLYWQGDARLANAYQLHNLPLQVLWDGGLLAAGGLLLAVLGLLRLALRLTGKAADPPLSLAATGVLGWLAFSLGDASLEVPLIAWLLGGLLAMVQPLPRAAAGPVKSPLRNPAFGRLLRWGGAVLLVSGWVVLTQLNVRTASARSTFADALQAAETGDLETFERLAEAAARTDPDEPLYLNQLGEVLRTQAETANRLEDARALRERARAAFENSLAIWPAQELTHSQLGWLLAESDPEVAATHFREACRLNPTSPVLWVGLSRALLETGQRDLARDALLLQLLAHPPFMTADVWHLGEATGSLRYLAGTDFLDAHARLAAESASIPAEKAAGVHRALQACWDLPIDLDAAAADPLLHAHLTWFMRSGPPSGPEAEALGAYVRQSLKRLPTPAELQSIPWAAYPPLPTETAAALATLRRMANRAELHVQTTNQRTAYPLLARNLNALTPADPPVITRKLARALLFEPLLPRGVGLSGDALLREAERRGLLQAPAALGEGDAAERTAAEG